MYLFERELLIKMQSVEIVKVSERLDACFIECVEFGDIAVGLYLLHTVSGTVEKDAYL